MQFCSFNLIIFVFSKKVLSFGLFLTFLLLLTVDMKFIAFNEFSSTGQYPAIYFYIAILLVVICFAMFIVSIFGAWATCDILNKWDQRRKLTIQIVN